MHQDHVAAMQAIAQTARGASPIEDAYVATYDGKGNVTVYLPHDLAAGNQVARGPYPILTGWVGDGWGIQFGPVGGGLDGNGNPTGEPCTVLYFDEDGEIGRVLLGRFNGKFKAMAVPAGEAWLVHKDGSKLKLKNGGMAQLLGQKVELGDDGASGDPDNAILRLKDLKAYHNNWAALHTHGTPFGPTSTPLSSFIGWVASLFTFSK